MGKKKTKMVQKEKKKKHVRTLEVSSYHTGDIRPYSPELMAESKAKLALLAKADEAGQSGGGGGGDRDGGRGGGGGGRRGGGRGKERQECHGGHGGERGRGEERRGRGREEG